MNCKECQNMIPAYLREELKAKEFEAFAAHVRSCKECYEEFETLYIIDLTTRILEEDQDHNFTEDIKTHILAELDEKEKKIRWERKKKVFIKIFYVFVAILALIFILEITNIIDLPFLYHE